MTIDADRKIKELSRAIIADAGLPYTPEQLAEIPAILAAKNRYFWCIDNQEFDLMPDVFTETGFRTFWSGRPGFRDRDAQVAQNRSTCGDEVPLPYLCLHHQRERKRPRRRQRPREHTQGFFYRDRRRRRESDGHA